MSTLDDLLVGHSEVDLCATCQEIVGPKDFFVWEEFGSYITPKGTWKKLRVKHHQACYITPTI